MKYTITLLVLIITSVRLHASDNPHTENFKAARARLRAARTKTAPEASHAEQEAPITMHDFLDATDDEEAFMRVLRTHLDDNSGCITWDDSCASSCPTWDTKEAGWDIAGLRGFDQSITCKSSLSSCYQSLQKCSQESLDTILQNEIDQFHTEYPKRRCKIAALICQGANPNPISATVRTALYIATAKDDYRLVKFLLEHGADPNKEAPDFHLLGYTTTNAHIANEFLQHGYKITNKLDSAGYGTLHWAMWDSLRDLDGEFTKTMLSHGADAHLKDRTGYTPLMLLAKHCSSYAYKADILIKKTKVLLQAGAQTRYRYWGFSRSASEMARHSEWGTAHACNIFADFIEAYEKQPNRILD